MANKKAKEKTKPIKFTKRQLLQSNKYNTRQDALNALLKDDKTYSHEEVEKVLNEFYEGGKK